MPPRAEATPGSREPRITAAGRAQLVDRVAEHIQGLIEDPKFKLVEREINKYIDVIGMAGVYEGGKLNPAQQGHLGKMIALETSLFLWTPPITGVKQLEIKIKSLVQPELAEMESFSEDLRDLPKDWDKAYNDLGKLMERMQ